MDIPDSRVMRLTAPLQVVPSGPGRLLTLFYSAGGLYVGRKVDRLVHMWGWGPEAVAKEIWKQVEKDGILSELADLDPDVIRKLRAKCQKLMKHTLPYDFPISSCCNKADIMSSTETPAAQLRAFKHIVHLATRVLGLRLMFLSSQHIPEFEAGISESSLAEFWKGDEPIPENPEWKFYLEFAASCVSDEDRLGRLVEDMKSDKLVSVPDKSGEYSVIETLLVAADSW
jgi:hypothetical protein